MLTPNYPVTSEAATITVVAPGGLAGDTSVPVAPLEIDIPSGYALKLDTGRAIILAEDAGVDDEALTVEELPFDVEAGLTGEIPGSAASAILSEKFAKLPSDEKRLATELVAEEILELPVGYVGDDAERLAFAKVLQINFMLERGYEPLVKKSLGKANPGSNDVFRDRWINPDAAVIVAKVTGRQQVRYAPSLAGV